MYARDAVTHMHVYTEVLRQGSPCTDMHRAVFTQRDLYTKAFTGVPIASR